MKTVIVVIGLWLVTFASYGQDKIEGIGRFKIGKTTINQASGDSAKIIEEHFEAIGHPNELFELKRNGVDSEEIVDEAPFSADLRILYSDSYYISQIEFPRLYLFFNKGILYKIKFDHSDEILDAFTLKYGKPKVSKSIQQVRCVYKLTGRTSDIKHNQTGSHTWLNGQIITIYSFRLRYDENCEGVYTDDFHIDNPFETQKVMALESTAMKALLAQRKLKRQKSLKDF